MTQACETLIRYKAPSLYDQCMLQNEEKQELAAASLNYNLDHAQLKAMFHSELQAAKYGSIRTDDQSASAQPTTNSQGADFSSSTQTGSSDSIYESGASSAQHADTGASHSGVDAQAGRLETLQIGDPSQAQPTSAVLASIQSAALDMLQKQLAEGQPEEALTLIEAALKYVDHYSRNAHELHEGYEGFYDLKSATVGGSPMKQTHGDGAHKAYQPTLTCRHICSICNLHCECKLPRTQDHTLIPSSNVQDVTLVVLQASSDTE